jgi:hypothetical protein
MSNNVFEYACYKAAGGKVKSPAAFAAPQFNR